MHVPQMVERQKATAKIGAFFWTKAAALMGLSLVRLIARGVLAVDTGQFRLCAVSEWARPPLQASSKRAYSDPRLS